MEKERGARSLFLFLSFLSFTGKLKDGDRQGVCMRWEVKTVALALCGVSPLPVRMEYTGVHKLPNANHHLSDATGELNEESSVCIYNRQCTIQR